MTRNCLPKLQQFYFANQTSLNTILGVITGLISGLVVKAVFLPNGQQIDPNLYRYLSLPGLLFVRAFIVLIVPLLITSLSTSFFSDTEATDSSDEINAKKLLLYTFTFFVCFSTFTSFLGITLVSIIQPGLSQNASPIISQIALNHSAALDHIKIVQSQIEHSSSQTDSFYNIVLNIFPDNLITALFLNTYTTTEIIWPSNRSSITEPNFVPTLRQNSSHAFKANTLGVCAISILLGILLQHMGHSKTATIRALLKEAQLLVNQSMDFLIKLMPSGMFCWMFTQALKMNSISQVVGQLAYLYAIIFLGFSIILLLFYPLITFLITRRNPFRIYSDIMPAILVAFGSASSAISLPMNMRCMEEKGGLSKAVVQLVLPLGMTLNMNGSALYYPSVALFVAQMKHIEVDTFSLAILCLFSVVMSMGFSGSPGGGKILVNHITFAAVLGIEDATDILAYIMAFEWILDRIRTPINIIGDCFVSNCIDQLIASKNQKINEINCELETVN